MAFSSSLASSSATFRLMYSSASDQPGSAGDDGKAGELAAFETYVSGLLSGFTVRTSSERFDGATDGAVVAIVSRLALDVGPRSAE